MEDPWLGWVAIVANWVTFLVYAGIAIALLLAWRFDPPKSPVLQRVLVLFAAFIAACGLVHGFEPVLFWAGHYRVKAFLEACMAVVSVAAGAYMVRHRKRLLRLRTEMEEDTKVFDALMSHPKIGVAEVIPCGRFESANQALAEMTGYGRSQLRGMRYQDITHPDDLENDRALHESMTAGERASYVEIKRYERAPRGSHRWFWVRIRPVQIRRQGVEKALVLVEDIDAEIRAKEELKNRVRELESRTSPDRTDALSQLLEEWAERDRQQRPQ